VCACARAIHRMICQCGTLAVAGAYNIGTTLCSGQLSGGVDKGSCLNMCVIYLRVTLVKQKAPAVLGLTKGECTTLWATASQEVYMLLLSVIDQKQI